MISTFISFALQAEIQPVTEARFVPREELSISGINVNRSIDEIISLLGEPLRKEVDSRSVETYTTLFYAGLVLYFGDDGLYEISAESRKYCTPAGICPGATIDKLKKTYGSPMYAKRPHGEFLEYAAYDYPCWLQLAMRNSVVHQLRVECSP